MSSRLRRVVTILALCIPAIIGAIVAVAIAAAHVNGALVFSLPLATIAISCGIVSSAALWAGLSISRALRSANAAGRSDGAQSERHAHRRFLARLDHELKNPITAIRAALETENEHSPALAIASGQADRLATLIGALRSLAALEVSEIERVPVDLAAVVRDEVDAFGVDLVARGLERTINVQLPTAPWPLPTVLGDADLLAVAVRNLLVNAAKYSDQGARIEVRGAEDAGIVVIEVADTGWGITAEDLPQVWDELWRSSDARKVEGSGLGLSLVRVVAEQHGGGVSIRSIAGSGTSVRLQLPEISAAR